MPAMPLHSVSAPVTDSEMGSDDDADDDDALGYRSEDEPPFMTDERACHKLVAVLREAELDLADTPDYNKPYDEHYDVAAAAPCLGGAADALVEILESMYCHLDVLVRFRTLNAPRSAVELLTHMFHMFPDDSLMLKLSLAVDAYVDCMRHGRMFALDEHPDPFAEALAQETGQALPCVTASSLFRMRVPRRMFNPETRATRRDTVETTGNDLLSTFMDLQRDVHSALQAAGLQTPIAWRLPAPLIVFVSN
jgi:hypothetical protein